jgi:hypothetical protein
MKLAEVRAIAKAAVDAATPGAVKHQCVVVVVVREMAMGGALTVATNIVGNPRAVSDVLADSRNAIGSGLVIV